MGEPGKKILAIQRLRGLAVLSVFYHHMASGWLQGRLPELPMAWRCFDLFFVISGYIVTQTLLSYIERPNGILAFYLRRAFRILPLALVCIVVHLTIIWLWKNPADRFSDAYEAAKQVLTLRYNYYLIHHKEGLSLGYFWSLMVEEHFYLLIPMVMLLIRGARARMIFCISVMAMLVTMKLTLHRFVAPADLENRLSIASECKFDELLLGVTLFLFRSRFKPRAPSFTLACIANWVGLFGIFSSLSFISGLSLPWIPMICGVLVYVASFDSGAIVSVPFGRLGRMGDRFWEWVGDRSYGIYLFQQINACLMYYFRVTDFPTAVAVPIYFVSMFLIAEFFYRTVERRFIVWGRSLSLSLMRSTAVELA